YIISFFFFQAEDGIRAFHVTGVQTCALPICILLSSLPSVKHFFFFLNYRSFCSFPEQFGQIPSQRPWFLSWKSHPADSGHDADAPGSYQAPELPWSPPPTRSWEYRQWPQTKAA